MLEKIISFLKQSNVDEWFVEELQTEGWEFYFIKHDLDQNRIRDIKEYYVTLYRYNDDRTMLGSASVSIEPTSSDEEIQKVIQVTYDSCLSTMMPVYELRTASQDCIKQEIDLRTNTEQFFRTIEQIKESDETYINSYEVFVDKVISRRISSKGADIYEEYPNSMLEIVLNAKNNAHEIELYRMYRSGDCQSDILQEDIQKGLGFGKDRLQAKPLQNVNQCDVVLSTNDAIAIYDYFLAQVNTQYIYQQFSNAKIGEPIAKDVNGDTISIYAKTYMDNSNRNSLYDSEGAKRRDLCLVENGIVKSYCGSQSYSDYVGAKDTFIVGNVEFVGGENSEEQLRKGDYLEIVEFSDFQVHPVSGDIFGEIRLAYYHHDGIVEAVTGGSVSGNMNVYERNLYTSKQLKQYNNYRIPSLTRIKDVKIATK